MITNCDSEESPLRDFDIANGDIFSAEIIHMSDGQWCWLVPEWKLGVDLEIMPDEAQIVGENVRPNKGH